jgi:hypothetical protein
MRPSLFAPVLTGPGAGDAVAQPVPYGCLMYSKEEPIRREHKKSR